MELQQKTEMEGAEADEFIANAKSVKLEKLKGKRCQMVALVSNHCYNYVFFGIRLGESLSHSDSEKIGTAKRMEAAGVQFWIDSFHTNLTN